MFLYFWLEKFFINNTITNQFMKALVTGASSGIGEEFAKQLSAKGYDVVLVARRQSNLESLASDLHAKYSVKPEVLVSDLSTYEGIAKAEDYIRSMDSLDMLVNNAGFGVPGRFQDIPMDKLQAMINLHVIASTRLCYQAIPKVKAIINVCSTAAFISKSGRAVYSATKSYLTMFSKALQEDVPWIKIQALCPGFTYSNFHSTDEFKGDKENAPKFLWMTPEQVVKKSLKALDRKEVVYVPGFYNKLLVSLMNNKLISPLVWKYYNRH